MVPECIITLWNVATNDQLHNTEHLLEFLQKTKMRVNAGVRAPLAADSRIARLSRRQY